ncbi:hypothetical protein ABZW11_07205 [Nonomuraea sp. NPDC004580]|uniref:hypothetical protein n=1 Tax=Nonomuraea sp. NPDC004580 TaxID=3154552 RepID=UPI0033B46569
MLLGLVPFAGQVLPGGDLLVGHWDDGWVLLNPRVRTAEGEWEAWFHAPWLPGAHRYRTFLDLMEREHGESGGRHGLTDLPYRFSMLSFLNSIEKRYGTEFS